MSFEAFAAQFGANYEEFTFYNGEVIVHFDKVNHEYFRITDTGEMIPLESVSKVGHIIDKSAALIPWAVKMMAQKLFATIPKSITKSGVEAVIMPYDQFEKAVMEAKTAHKDKLEDAGNVGHMAHNWIERYIKDLIRYKDDTETCWAYDVPREDPRAANCCLAAMDWMGRHNVRWISTEQKIFSRELDVPGTMDGKAIVDSCQNPACCPEQFKDRLSLIDWKTSNHLYIEYILQLSMYWHADFEEHGTVFEDGWIIRLGKEDGEFDPWHLDKETVNLGFRSFKAALTLSREIKALENRDKQRREAISAIKKAQSKEETRQRHLLACPYSSKYKGSRYPGCEGPCKKCLDIYAKRMAEKHFGWVWKEWPLLLGPGEKNVTDKLENNGRMRLSKLLDGLL